MNDWRPTRAEARDLVLADDAYRRKLMPFFRKQPALTDEAIEELLAAASGRHAFWRDTETPRPIDEALSGATLGQMIAYCVIYSHNDVCNGGFHQYFTNATGDLAESTVAALRAIGEHVRVALFLRAMARFPGGMAPRHYDERVALLEDYEEWTAFFRPIEDEYYAFDAAAQTGAASLGARVDAYTRAHPEELFRDG